MRHNIVGTLDSEGSRIKDYLLPVTLETYNKTIDSIPKIMREDAVSDVALLCEKYPIETSSSRLKSTMLLCHTTRISAANEFRALITYNSNSEDWPENRDDVFIGLLSSFLYQHFISPDFSLNDSTSESVLFENLIALAVLDESIGVREPRASVARAFSIALFNMVQDVVTGTSTSSTIEGLKERVSYMEKLLTLCLRLPDGSEIKCRQSAFKKYIDFVFDRDTESSNESSSSGSTGISIFKKIEKLYPVAAAILSIDLKVAKSYVGPLGVAKFDKVVGSMLMNADIAVGVPDIGKLLQSQLYELADDIMLDRKQADVRILAVAAAVLQSFLETILEENRQMNSANIDTVLAKAYYICQHPIVILIQKIITTDELKNIKQYAIKSTAARIGSQLFVELIRAVESARQRITLIDVPSVSTSGISLLPFIDHNWCPL